MTDESQAGPIFCGEWT